MDRSQIRWKNVGRLAAGAAGAGALLVVGPGLLDPPQPPPLPPDVGLATGATGPVVAQTPDPEPVAREPHANERREDGERRRKAGGRADKSRSWKAAGEGLDGASSRDRGARQPLIKPAAVAPRPAAPPPPPVPAPTAATPPPPVSSAVGPVGEGRPESPAEFGFEH